MSDDMYGFSPSWLPPHLFRCPSYLILVHSEGTLNLTFPASYLITVIATVSWWWSISLSPFTRDMNYILTLSWVSPCLPPVNTQKIRPLGLPPRTLCYSDIGHSSQCELTLPALKVVYLNCPLLPLHSHMSSNFTSSSFLVSQRFLLLKGVFISGVLIP